jgi:hypothetical protein
MADTAAESQVLAALSEAVGVTRNVGGALLFMQSGMTIFDSVSAVNSSPLTAERYGADPSQAQACLEYTLHGLIISTGYATGAALVARSWWPLVGVAPGALYLWWMYTRAIARAQARGPVDWQNFGG